MKILHVISWIVTVAMALVILFALGLIIKCIMYGIYEPIVMSTIAILQGLVTIMLMHLARSE